MKRFAPLAMAVSLIAAGIPAVVSAQAASPAAVGKMLYDANGARVGKVNRVNAAGDAQVIYNGRLVTVAAATLSEADGKLTTSVARRDIGR